MIIKPADDKTRRLALLEDLQRSPRIDARQRDWLADQFDRTRKGMAGERDAAHYLDNHLRDSRNHMVLHDLRLQIDGETAQIDHLIINRVFDFFLLETKNFGGDVCINEHGEFSVRYGARSYGIPSPIEQSRRHANVLRKVLKQIGITDRFKSEPNFEHVVLVHPKASIKRPPAQAFDTGNVIKADQFEHWRDQHIDRLGVAATLVKMLNWHGQDAVREAAERLARQHRPEDPLRLPTFLAPAVVTPTSPPIRAVAAPRPAPAAAATPVTSAAEGMDGKRLVCMTCHTKISFAEGRFCWNNEKRFGGRQYCREHQTAFAASSARLTA